VSIEDVFPIVSLDDPAGKERLARLTTRVADLEALESKAARERTIATFGEPLAAIDVVRRIITDVRDRGDAALIEYAKKLDGVEMSAAEIRVSKDEIDRAVESVPAAFASAVARAAQNIRSYQTRLLPQLVEMRGEAGLTLGARWNPVERAACYVPGGTASYPSSVLMNAIPAQVAGVEHIVLAMPPGKEGAGNPKTLAAAGLIGCTQIVRIGGVQAIAALAYGTDTIPKVDTIVGPGNLFVMLAKREVFGRVNIDMFAGPSEILVIADDATDPALAAMDLMSQAEHDQMASAILVSTSRELAGRVRDELLAILENHPRKAIAEESLLNYGLALVVPDLAAACRVADGIAPEHLELLCRDAQSWAEKIHNAGAVFMGPWAPESLGDYAAGPSHTLPTGGTARFMSGLSPLSFMKRTSLIGADASGLKGLLDVIDELARADGLPSHADSARRRFGR
jgi:histidinol dehydrogenase